MIIENELTRSTNIERLLSIRERSINNFVQAHGLLNETNSLFKDNEILSYSLFSNTRDCGIEINCHLNDALKSFTRNIDSNLWRYMMDKTNMFDVMDSQTKNKFSEGLRNPPAFTKENIASTFENLMSARGYMFEQGIINLFKNLSWNYKSNQPQKIGKKIIMSGMICQWSKTINVGYPSDRLIDLERVILKLDSKQQPANGELLPYASREAIKKTGCYKNDYLEIKGFKNGNAHIVFLRLDIVDKMNSIIAKHYPGALPAPK